LGAAVSTRNWRRDRAAVSFTDEEIAYLQSQPLARLASIGADDQPDVVPVGYEFDGRVFRIGGVGGSVLGTRKFRNIRAGRHKVALESRRATHRVP
jgi:pyridoxamine 5'-phosphate oxidase family protein